jgi:signal transduction histidine kinase
MKKHRSLSLRLVVYLMGAQTIGFLSLPLVSFIFLTADLPPGNKMFLRDWGQPYAEELLIDSLRRPPNGSAYIEQTAALADYIKENPECQFAAFDSGFGAALPGSSPELTAALVGMKGIQANLLKFHIAGDPNPDSRGLLRRVSLPPSDIYIATYGYSFHLLDVFYMALTYLNISELLIFAPTILGALLIAWLVVRRGLAPLRVAAEEVSSIKMDSLDQRIQDTDIPREVAPFVRAVNEALTRLSAEVRTQRRFLANAAHELFTPIAILRARIDNLDESFLKEDIKHDVRRVQLLIEQLLAFARISSRKSSLRDEINLVEMVSELVADYMPLIVAKGRDIEFEAPACSVVARGNRQALESAVTNLIDNALRAEPANGTILVRVKPSATIEVVDHGEGIAPLDNDKIFEPFWRKDDKTPGTGLGLSIVKDVIESHHGAVSVESTPGGGATFRIELEQGGA